MLLSDASSKEEVQAALDAGDEELRNNIVSELEDAARLWERKYADPLYDEAIGESLGDIIGYSDDFREEVIRQSPAEWDLAKIPEEEVKDALASASRQRTPPFEWYGGRRHYGQGIGFRFSHPTQVEYHFDPDRTGLMPDNWELIPDEFAEDFFADLGYGIEWQDTSRIREAFGFAEGEPMEIVSSEDDFNEFCRDTIATYIDKLVRSDPAKAKEMFFAAIGERRGNALREAALPDEELLDLISSYYSGGSDQEEALDSIDEYIDSIKETGEPREVKAEITRDDLRSIGITQGTFWENAPWKLIKLQAPDLRLEGTRMNHCVGQKGMGYVKAVRDGETQIWSLRDRSDKPRFTLQVDPSFDTAEDESVSTTGGKLTYFTAARQRARAIEQVKGKGNRTPGHAQKGDAAIKFPDEVKVWEFIFNKLGVDPEHVDDFDAYELKEKLAENRRSSRRRSSKRRSSRRLPMLRNPSSLSFDEPYRREP